MIYRFTLLSDEVDDFARIIEIDSDASFFDLHEAILDSVGFTKDEVTSFYLCSDSWEREQEITLIEMETESEYDNLVMTDTILSDYLEDEKQKLVYIFDTLSERMFFIELTDIITRKNLSEAVCTFKKGKINQQEVEISPKENSKILLEDVFEGEELIDMAEISEEDYSNIDLLDDAPYTDDSNF